MTTEQKIIRNKVGLLGLVKLLGKVSQPCKIDVSEFAFANE
jgi:hypothetical protein